MQPTLEFITEITLHAVEIIKGFIGEEMNVQHKTRTDLVTKADQDSERYLIDAIQKAFPKHAINAEESGEWEGDPEHQWFLDPLDGTLNFAHGVPFYCVSVGYAYRGDMALGVVYDPLRDEVFAAERGQGATLNQAPMRVSDERELINCMLVTGFPHDQAVWGTPADNTANFYRFNTLCQSVRRLGSAALDVVYVAAGRLDGFWQLAINQWDVAAGGLIVREAGGIVTDVFGNPDFLAKPVSFLCANPTIHKEMRRVLEDVRAA
jgi:myo-inositol-1(or 4)-monophosphatase